MISAGELMQLHVDALFTCDAVGDLDCVNEPNGAPAPRFFLGATADGPVLRFRRDLDAHVRGELKAVIGGDHGDLLATHAALAARCGAILAHSGVVERIWSGPAFAFPGELPADIATTRITPANEHLLEPLFEAWRPDVGRPMAATIVEGRAVAVCCSVRETPLVHEAGVETAAALRGRGYAGHAVTEWARIIRELNRVPLYSTSWQNDGSRALARKLGLLQFGADLHIT